MLAVLWVTTGLAILALAVSLGARQGVAAARNRIALMRAGWSAEDCLERARATIASALAGDGRGGGNELAPWRSLDSVVASSVIIDHATCVVTIEPAGVRMNVNAADAEQLDRLFRGLGIASPLRDSLADALLDWRDPDDFPRPHGAERAWYEERGRHPPRNAALADFRELARIRGFEQFAGLDSVIATESGRIWLDRAPLTVLGSLPGMTREALARLAEQRLRGERIDGLIELGALLSPAARDSLLARYATLLPLVTADPDAWILTARAGAHPEPATVIAQVTATVEVRLVRAGARAAIVRRRTWQ